MSRVDPSSSVGDGSEESVGHGGPLMPWETLFDPRTGPVSREELVGDLAGDGLDEETARELVEESVERGELDAGPDGLRVGAASRHTNSTKFANHGRDANTDELVSRAREIAAQFAEEYPDRADTRVTSKHGSQIRRKFAHVSVEEWDAETGAVKCDVSDCGMVVGAHRRGAHFEEQHPEIVESYGGSEWVAAVDLTTAVDDASGVTETDVTAATWREAVGMTAYSYLQTKQTTINLRKGNPGGEHFAEFSVDAESRWFKSYQKRYFARLKGWLRELTGGERPSGGETVGQYDDPHIALLTRSASSVPDGDRIGPVELFDRLGDSRKAVKRRLRYELETVQGFGPDEWQYTWVVEPHTSKRGGGTNAAYPHEHMVVVFDGEVEPSDLRGVMQKHVEETPGASMDAHGEEAIEIRDPDELTNVAAYVADYAAIRPQEFLERSPAYHGFAAAASASNRRVFQQSDTAKWASDADRCKQQYESGEAVQDADHGEEIRRKNGRVVCEHCGSPHGIDQDRTVTSHRLDDPAPDVAADGGAHVADRETELFARWSSADAAATVGESRQRTSQRRQLREFVASDRESLGAWWAENGDGPPPSDPDQLLAEIEHPDHDPEEVVGFDFRHPEWRVHSITVDGEEHMASGGGVDMVSVTAPVQNLRESLDLSVVGERRRDGAVVGATRIDGERVRYVCACGASAYGDGVVDHLLTHDITDPDRASDVIAHVPVGEDMADYPERYGPAVTASTSDGEGDVTTWMCDRHADGRVAFPKLGDECYLCGESEPPDAKRV